MMGSRGAGLQIVTVPPVRLGPLASSPLQSVTFHHVLGWGDFARSPDRSAALSQGLGKTDLPPQVPVQPPNERGVLNAPPTSHAAPPLP